ncbi:MAG: MFS transporter [Planctomycetales bacterium]
MSEDQRPTRVRYRVLAVTACLAVLLYLDRFCVSFAVRYIQEDLRLSEDQIGLFLGIFFFTYALGQVPGGWLADRYGARFALVLFLTSWSLFTGLMGWAEGFVFLMLMRMGCGLTQAGAFPSCGSLLRQWVPPENRATASSIVSFGGRIGGAAAPVLTAFVMLLFVPLSYPSQFQSRDLLPGNEKQFFQKLLHPKTPWEREISAKIPETLHTALATEESQGNLTPQTRENLVREFNRQLTNEVMFTTDLVKLPGLDRQAARYAEEREQGKQLTPQEITRLNRLTLEAVFPQSLRKLNTAGWRPMLVLFGSAGFVVAFVFWLVARDRPEEHPRCNPAELALIRASEPSKSAAVDSSQIEFPWREMLTSPVLWASSLSQFFTNLSWIFLVTLLPTYLELAHHVEFRQRAWMASVPIMVGIAGNLLGGPFSDWCVRWAGRRRGRAVVVLMTRVLAGFCYWGCLWTNDPWIATILFSGVAFFTDLGVPAVWAFAQDVGGKVVGAILGWGNMWGNFASALAPSLFLFLTKRPEFGGASFSTNPGENKNWNAVFVCCGLAFVISGLLGWGMRADEPIQAVLRSDRAEENSKRPGERGTG